MPEVTPVVHMEAKGFKTVWRIKRPKGRETDPSFSESEEAVNNRRTETKRPSGILATEGLM